MVPNIKERDQVLLNKKYLEDLKKKAAFLEELLSFIEEKYLGFLMEKTEKEKNIPLSKAKKFLK